jgi:hypothetical protein
VALLSLPPRCNDLEIGWQISPTRWGQGYGAEAGHAVAHQAFEHTGISELFAVIRPGNHRGVATARRDGMDWVGETNKYYGLDLQVYRLNKDDLDLPEPACAPAPRPAAAPITCHTGLPAPPMPQPERGHLRNASAEARRQDAGRCT